MPTFKQFVSTGVVLAAALFLAGMAQAAGPGLGEPATAHDFDVYDSSVLPNGEGLPPGSSSAAQGKAVFEAKCAVCHGANGEGKPADALVGGQGTLNTPKPKKTVGSYWPYATTFFDFVRRAMPYNAPKSLSNDELYGVVAYVLFLNEIVPQDLVLNAQTLPKVAMPNRNGFVNAWPNDQNR